MTKQKALAKLIKTSRENYYKSRGIVDDEMSKAQLARRMKAKKQSISQWESGNTMPTLKSMVKLADILNIEWYLVFDTIHQNE